MKIIINENSLEGQFDDMDCFLDSLCNNTLPVLDILKFLDISILKSANMYCCKITKDKVVYDVLKLRGSAEIRKLKKLLSNLLLDDPYWDSSSEFDADACYKINGLKISDNYSVAEALERKIPVISFEHSEFMYEEIKVYKNDIKNSVSNLYNKENSLDFFKKMKMLNPSKFLFLKYGNKKSFGLNCGRDYFEDLYKNASLKYDDVVIILDDIEKLIKCSYDQKNPGRLSKTIEGKLKEFRTSLSDNREIRIFYYEEAKNIIFLNGFLKKTEKTPKLEIDRAKLLMKRMSNTPGMDLLGP